MEVHDARNATAGQMKHNANEQLQHNMPIS